VTVPLAPGVDDTLGPALASLTDTIGSLLKPTAKYDQALKQIFLTKPELMQKFVDVEKANPGTLKAFGFGEGATNLVGGMQESIQSIRERHLAPEVDAALSDSGTAKTVGKELATGKTEAQIAGEKLQTWMLGGGLELVRTNPAAADAAIRRTLGIKSADEMTLDKDTMDAYNSAKSLKDRSIPEIVSGVANGTIPAQQISGGLLNPATQGAVKAGLHQYQQDRDDATAKELAGIRATAAGVSAAGGASVMRAKINAAADQYKASGGVAPIGAFYERMWGEPYKDTPAPEEDLAKVDEFMKATQADKAVKSRAAVLKGIEPLYNSVMIRKKGTRPVNKEYATAQVKKINNILEAAKSDWHAEYDEVGHWFKANEPQIVLRDAQGNVTRDLTAITSNVPGAETYKAKDLIGIGQGPNLTAEQRRIAFIENLYKQDSTRGGDGSAVEAIVDSSEVQ